MTMAENEKALRIFENHLSEFSASINQSWEKMIFLAKQAAGYWHYQRKSLYLERYWQVISRTRYRAAAQKILSALLYGITIRNGETYESRLDYIINGKLAAMPQGIDKRLAWVNALPQSVETFTAACDILGLKRKACGLQAAQAQRLLKYS